jgi:hypothetical protein
MPSCAAPRRLRAARNLGASYRQFHSTCTLFKAMSPRGRAALPLAKLATALATDASSIARPLPEFALIAPGLEPYSAPAPASRPRTCLRTVGFDERSKADRSPYHAEPCNPIPA